ncbi:hypothetical protein [Periweissella cryptocerci]|uniref:hypothetical protein n=1 Tax=Periweissella cryptocerci TaxID=2506420 RepID=UPI0014053D27|nr:hypothetical protein [Periweissella cryptocerci]
METDKIRVLNTVKAQLQELSNVVKTRKRYLHVEIDENTAYQWREQHQYASY